MVERQTIATMGEHVKKFSCLKFTIAGTVPEDPESQDEATVDLRIFAQSQDPDVLSASAMIDSDRGSFARFCIENLLQGYPGSTMAPDMRQAIGRPFFPYSVTLIRSHSSKRQRIFPMAVSLTSPLRHLLQNTHGNTTRTTQGIRSTFRSLGPPPAHP